MITLSLASCQKFEMEDMPTPDEPTTTIYSLDLRFDANVSEATVAFYDESGYQVSAKTLAVPASTTEVVSIAFASETAPEYIYTDGLQNGEEGGLLRIPAASIETKASDNSILLVIR